MPRLNSVRSREEIVIDLEVAGVDVDHDDLTVVLSLHLLPDSALVDCLCTVRDLVNGWNCPCHNISPVNHYPHRNCSISPYVEAARGLSMGLSHPEHSEP